MEWKKTKKLQKCNFATLQLFGLIAFSYCFLIKKGKKQQKLQSCKVAFLQLFGFFFKKFWPKKIWMFLWCFFFELQKFGFQKPYPYFLGVWIQTVFMSETLSLFFFFFFFGGGGWWISTVFISETLSLFFFFFFWGGGGGGGSQQFLFQKPYPYFFLGGWISTVFISETFFLFFWEGIDLNSFHFRNLLPIFFGGD